MVRHLFFRGWKLHIVSVHTRQNAVIPDRGGIKLALKGQFSRFFIVGTGEHLPFAIGKSADTRQSAAVRLAVAGAGAAINPAEQKSRWDRSEQELRRPEHRVLQRRPGTAAKRILEQQQIPGYDQAEIQSVETGLGIRDRIQRKQIHKNPKGNRIHNLFDQYRPIGDNLCRSQIVAGRVAGVYDPEGAGLRKLSQEAVKIRPRLLLR